MVEESVDLWEQIYSLAGVLGIDPGPFTLRQLVIMSTARRRDEWDRAAGIIAMIYNVNCGPRDKPKSPADFNPYAEKPTPPTISLQALHKMMPKL